MDVVCPRVYRLHHGVWGRARVRVSAVLVSRRVSRWSVLHACFLRQVSVCILVGIAGLAVEWSMVGTT